jgi:hypothetical protein
MKFTSMQVPVSSGFLKDVWGASPTDVWVVGGEGSGLHWNGAGWSTAPIGPYFSGIWGAAADDIWALLFRQA